MKALIVAALAFGLGGCAAAGHADKPLPAAYDVHISTAWWSEADVVIGALNDWSDAVGVSFRITMTDDACTGPDAAFGYESCFAIMAPTSVAVVDANCQTPNIGCTHSVPGQQVNILVDAAQERSTRAHILRHEIGHALGLVHVRDLSALMYPSIDGASEVAPIDVSQYQALRY